MKAFIFLLCVLLHSTSCMMTGGWSPITDMNSPDFQKCVNFSVKKISSASNSLYHMKLIDAVDARKQVVSGTNYKFRMRIGPTECKKNVQYSNEDLSQCPFLSCKATQICDAVVWYQPWNTEEPMKLTKYTCENEPKTC